MKLLVVEGDNTLYDRAIVCRLSEGLQQTGRLSDEPMKRTIETIRGMLAEAGVSDASSVNAIVTAPGRAPNGGDFVARLEAALGVRARVVTGDEEAAISVRATRNAFPGLEALLMVDLGGASTEFVLVEGDEASDPISVDVGAVRLTDAFLAVGEGAEAMQRAREAARAFYRPAVERCRPAADVPKAGEPPAVPGVVLVSGTATTLACLHLELDSYRPDQVHETVLTVDDVAAIVAKLHALTIPERRALPGLDPKRADVILGGALLVEAILDVFGVAQAVVSDRGARWGLVT